MDRMRSEGEPEREDRGSAGRVPTPAPPGLRSVAGILAMQSSAGNAAVARALVIDQDVAFRQEAGRLGGIDLGPDETAAEITGRMDYEREGRRLGGIDLGPAETAAEITGRMDYEREGRRLGGIDPGALTPTKSQSAKYAAAIESADMAKARAEWQERMDVLEKRAATAEQQWAALPKRLKAADSTSRKLLNDASHPFPFRRRVPAADDVFTSAVAAATAVAQQVAAAQQRLAAAQETASPVASSRGEAALATDATSAESRVSTVDAGALQAAAGLKAHMDAVEDAKLKHGQPEPTAKERNDQRLRAIEAKVPKAKVNAIVDRRDISAADLIWLVDEAISGAPAAAGPQKEVSRVTWARAIGLFDNSASDPTVGVDSIGKINGVNVHLTLYKDDNATLSADLPLDDLLRQILWAPRKPPVHVTLEWTRNKFAPDNAHVFWHDGRPPNHLSEALPATGLANTTELKARLVAMLDEWVGNAHDKLAEERTRRGGS